MPKRFKDPAKSPSRRTVRSGIRTKRARRSISGPLAGGRSTRCGAASAAGSPCGMCSARLA